MMGRQARPSGLVMGLDTHMISGSRACSISIRLTHSTITSQPSQHYAEALGLMVRVVAVDPEVEDAVGWRIESPTPGVVLVDVGLGGDPDPVPLHWRAGEWSKPPLDLAIDPVSGRLQALQFVLQDERVPVAEVAPLPAGQQGVPVLEVAGWPADRYRDVRCPVAAIPSQAGELVLRLGRGGVANACRVRGGLAIGYDRDGDLGETRVGPLADDDWESIDSFSVVG
jgi:hypothetical protein